MISQRGKGAPGAAGAGAALARPGRAAGWWLGRAGLMALGCIGLGVGLAGCAGPGRPAAAPRAVDAVIAPDLMFQLADGAVLPARRWLPAPGLAWRGAILALHGYTDSRDAWELPAPRFAASGYAVYAPDQRGFGATASRGRWAGGGQLTDDAAALVRQLRARHAGRPVIVMGESMGGAIAALLAARPDAPQDATVLLAPALWGWDQLNPGLAAALRAANALAPGWAPDPGRAPPVLASDNIAALLRMGRDPLTLRAPPIAMTKGLVDLMSDAGAAMPGLHGRVLILDGRRDQLVPGAATAAAWARAPACVRLGFYPQGYHLLLRDRARDLVIDDVLAWLARPDAWLPSGADAAASAWVAARPWQGGAAGWLPAAGLDTDFGPAVWPY